MQIFSTTAQKITPAHSFTPARFSIFVRNFFVKVQHDRLLLRVCPQREVTERITLLKKNIAVNPERVQELVEKGVLKPDTLKKRAKALEDFGNFLAANHNLSLYEELANPGLEGFLMVFCEIKEVEVLKFPSSL